MHIIWSRKPTKSNSKFNEKKSKNSLSKDMHKRSMPNWRPSPGRTTNKIHTERESISDNQEFTRTIISTSFMTKIRWLSNTKKKNAAIKKVTKYSISLSKSKTRSSYSLVERSLRMNRGLLSHRIKRSQRSSLIVRFPTPVASSSTRLKRMMIVLISSRLIWMTSSCHICRSQASSSAVRLTASRCANSLEETQCSNKSLLPKWLLDSARRSRQASRPMCKTWWKLTQSQTQSKAEIQGSIALSTRRARRV